MKEIFPILEWLPYKKEWLKGDISAGLSVSIILIPQAIAFAMIAGLPPVYGFYTAMLTPIIAAIFGSSIHLISGPTTISSIVLYGIISKFISPYNDIEAFISLAILLSFMAGIIKLFMGLMKMGKLVNFISNSVIIGFSAGAGVLIAFKQLKHVLGIKVPQGNSFYEIISYISLHIQEINLYALAIAILTIATALIIKKIKKLSRLYMLFAMVFGSIFAYYLSKYTGTIQTVGEIPSNLPPFKIPAFNLENMKMLSGGALTLATLGLLETSAISKSIALHSQQKLNTNQEFISQGISNTISSFFSCYSSSGSFTRSNINYHAGAKTPISAFISSFILILVILLFAKYTIFLPIPAMGGIILLVAYNLIDFKRVKQIIESSKKELIVFSITFLGTLFLDLQIAIVLGVLLSLFFYLERTSKPNIVALGLDKSKKRLVNKIRSKEIKECSNLKIIRIDGSIYFGSIEEIANFFTELYKANKIKYILVVSNGINFIDLSGSEWLTHEVLKWQKNREGIYFSGMKNKSQDILEKGKFIEKMGKDIFFTNKKIAIKSIHEKINTPCAIKVFDECN